MARNKAKPDSENYGKKIKYAKDFCGPGGKRSCTDVICLLIFVAFLGLWVFIGHYAITKGDVNRILLPSDSNGLTCGLSEAVQNQTKLMFFDLQKCINPLVAVEGCDTPKVCVSQCPNETFLFNRTVCSNAGAGALQTFKDKMLCTRDVNMNTITSCDDIENKIVDNKCVRWYLKSMSLSNRCIPEMNVTTIQDIFKESASDITEAIKNVKTLSDLNEVGKNIVSDIRNTWIPTAVCLFLAMLCCLIFIAMMRWLAAPMLWLSILGVIVMLSSAIYYTQMQFLYFKANPPREVPTAMNMKDFAGDLAKNKTFWLVLLIVSTSLLAGFLLLVLILRKRISIAIALVKEGSKAVSSTYSTVLFPIIPWILQIVVIGFAIVVFLHLQSIGEPIYKVNGWTKDAGSCVCSGEAASFASDGAICDLKMFKSNCHHNNATNEPCREAACHFVKMGTTYMVLSFKAATVLGFYWVLFFISAFGQMVLAGTFATWYWSLKKSNVPFLALTDSLTRTLRYHLGTCAFGSLLIAICRIIRLILTHVERKLKGYDNAFTRALICCLKCFFWCLENFLRFLNKNSYIMCAVHGSNFCTSSKNAFNLVMRNLLRVYALDKVTSFLFFLSKMLVTLGTGAVTYTYFSSEANDVELNYIFVPSIMVMIGTYLISSVFFSVYSMAVDTLFLCFLEDSERNDGSAEKPYYMSKGLMKILGTKNELSSHHYK